MGPLRKRWQSRSLRTRILTVTAVATALVVLLVTVTSYVLVDTSMRRAATTSSQDQVRQVIGVLAESDEPPPQSISDVSSRGSLIQLLDSHGQVVASNDPAARSPLTSLRPGVGQVTSSTSTEIPTDEGRLYVVAVGGFHHDPTNSDYRVVLAAPISSQATLLRRSTGTLAGVGLILVVALVLLVSRAVATALGSMEKIRSSVAEIEASDLSVRVPKPPGNDEVARLADTMNTMLDRLHRADLTQRAFVSNASHELRSPITALRTIVETSRQGLAATQVSTAHSEILRLEHLVTDLLTLAKADDRGLAARPTSVTLADTLWDEVYRLKAISGHQIECDVDGDVLVTVDPEQLRQMVSNLGDNAVRHAATSVRLGATDDHDQVRIWVDNDGQHIPVDHREVIFDRFVRLDDSRQRDEGGSGLGLAIVKALATANHGTVRAVVNEQGWTRFDISLPRATTTAQSSTPGSVSR